MPKGTNSKARTADRHSAVQRALYILLALAAAISLLRGLQNALTNSADIQWSPMVVFWQAGLDPYQVLLQDPYSPRFILSQGPNNLHFLFFLLTPLAFVNFTTAKILWVAANIGFLAATLWIFH